MKEKTLIIRDDLCLIPLSINIHQSEAVRREEQCRLNESQTHMKRETKDNDLVNPE